MHIWCNIRVLEGPLKSYFARNPTNRLKHQRLGTLSMVNDGNDLHGSQVGSVVRETGVEGAVHLREQMRYGASFSLYWRISSYPYVYPSF